MKISHKEKNNVLLVKRSNDVFINQNKYTDVLTQFSIFFSIINLEWG